MGIDSSVAVEAMQKLAAALERCEERLRDKTWWNRVNPKNAIDEKVLPYSAKSNGICWAVWSFVRRGGTHEVGARDARHHSLAYSAAVMLNVGI
jgi:hypothetical protein